MIPITIGTIALLLMPKPPPVFLANKIDKTVAMLAKTIRIKSTRARFPSFVVADGIFLSLSTMEFKAVNRSNKIIENTIII
jgi:hypothetical protein